MEDCTICSEPLAVPGASLTRCGHVFHSHCIQRWFEQKPLCPLCKARCTESPRLLCAPAMLDAEEAARMSVWATGDPSGAAAADAVRQLRADADRCAHDATDSKRSCDLETEQLRHKRAALHRLESEVLKVRRELAAAERIEAAATSATSVEGSDGVADGAENEPPLLRLDAERAVSREAVAQQSRQLAWRCQEIRALDDKIASAGGMTRGARRA